MKVGFQTILFGPRIEDLEWAFDVIAAAGYQGVEIAQRPEFLGDIDRLRELLQERSLTLLGLAGGTLRERMEFCGTFRPSYLYLERWEAEACADALERGFTLALHPHAFTRVHRLGQALSLLRDHPELRFLPDTAHLTIVRDNLLEGLRRTKDRIAAVHLKDWTPAFGRASHRYARGFVELGAGTVPLDSVVSELRRLGYSGWVVAEQDSTRSDPEASAVASAEWLHRAGLLLKPPGRISRFPSPRHRVGAERPRVCTPAAEARFLQSVMQASALGVEACYETIAQAYYELVPCRLLTLWTCSPAHDLMSLVAAYPSTATALPDYGLRTREALSGLTLERKAVTRFDLTRESTRRRFGHSRLLEELDLTQMVSVPVLSPSNPNQVRLVVNLFPREPVLPVSDEELMRFGQCVAVAADGALEEFCSTAAALANFQAGQSRQVRDFLDSVVTLIRNSVHCEAVSIFLLNDLGDRLELAATTGVDWTVPEDRRFYARGEGLTGMVWERNESILTADVQTEPGHTGKAVDRAVSTQRRVGLFAPLVNSSDEVVGVVRCRNKTATDGIGVAGAFSQDDAAVLEAIAYAVVPHLQVLVSQERRAKALGKLTHELRMPLVAIRGATEFMLKTRGVREFFDYDYPGDIWSWTDLMARLLGNADLFRYSSEPIPLRPSRTFLLKEVVSPAVRQVELLLRERNLPPNRIRRGTFEEVPLLWVDRNLFQQVIFNLLSNAIKYSYGDPTAFGVEIVGENLGAWYAVRHRDWGPGIDPGMEEAIFEEGTRGPLAAERDVAGQGLGLWVVRRIVEAHDGRVEVTNSRLPTEFTIFLPAFLASRPPRARG